MKMKKPLQRIIAATIVVAVVVGVHLTYKQYRGSEHSRVPTRAGVQRTSNRVEASADAQGVRASFAAHRKVNAADDFDDAALRGMTNELTLYPSLEKGMRTPFDLWRYYGRGRSSYNTPVLPMRFDQWLEFHRKQKPELMRDLRDYMAGRYDFHGETIPGAYMSGGKPIMRGPIARLPKRVKSFEELANISAAEMRRRDLFPYKPLAHPLQSTAHMLFPDSWIKAHPEHSRIDVDFDMPDAYLPEFPPPMFLTTHKELGDVTNGQEVTLDNFYEIFDGLLTPEQMEGLKELLRPSPTTWFNHTEHRLTERPSQGVACMAVDVTIHERPTCSASRRPSRTYR